MLLARNFGPERFHLQRDVRMLGLHWPRAKEGKKSAATRATRVSRWVSEAPRSAGNLRSSTESKLATVTSTLTAPVRVLRQESGRLQSIINLSRS